MYNDYIINNYIRFVLFHTVYSLADLNLQNIEFSGVYLFRGISSWYGLSESIRVTFFLLPILVISVTYLV